MSIAMVNRPPVAVYREEQWFSGWIYAGLVGLAVMAVGLLVRVDLPVLRRRRGARDAGPPAMAAGRRWSGLSLPPVLVVGLLRMTTEVHPTELRLWFGLIPTYRHVVPLDAVRAVEPVRYRPIADCGGWGIRRGRDGERVFTARGDRGVRLTLHDGSTLLVGSQRPEELARTIDRTVRDLC